eukprot:CAMPEP_0114494300 /NCGR_PEP_ID=MMETSP0109-20121206/4581_1 /TAXON_ID=29199 /ORGANISM="Chlorarachnion reptans, Strain CCCM449" /LENGTH=638 /DNA_ID=CAMNT_0001671333 /DNA_START=918 /DNA_END=2833 /DNA_ORIENTATION=-
MCNSLRFGYSRCFTLAWIDILVFDKVVSESRGLLLGPRMPFFLVCSGRGSYECPFHLEVEDSMVRKAGECFGSTWGIFLVHLNQYLRTLTQSEILELQSSSSAADDKKLLGDGFSTGYLGGSSSTERQDHIEKKFERFKSKRIFWRKDREQRLQGLRSMIRSMKTSNVGLQLAVQMHNSSEDSLLRPVLIVRELLPKIVRPKVKIASPAKLEKNQAELHRRRQKEEEYRPLSRDKKHTSLDIQAPLKFGGNESLAHSHFSPGGSEDRKETAVPPEVATQESEQVDVAPAAQERDRSKNVVHFGLESFESDMKRTVGISSPSLKDNTSQTPNPIKRERKTKQKMTVPSGSNTYNDRNDEDHSVEQYDLMAVEEWNDDRFMEKLLRHRGSDASSGSNNDNSKLFRPILTTINSNDIDDNVSVEVSLSPEVFEPERDSPMGDGKHEHFQGLPAADSVENFLPYADAENLGRIPPNIKTLADLESESPAFREGMLQYGRAFHQPSCFEAKMALGYACAWAGNPAHMGGFRNVSDFDRALGRRIPGRGVHLPACIVHISIHWAGVPDHTFPGTGPLFRYFQRLVNHKCRGGYPCSLYFERTRFHRYDNGDVACWTEVASVLCDESIRCSSRVDEGLETVLPAK